MFLLACFWQGKIESRKPPKSDSLTWDVLIVFATREEKQATWFDSELNLNQLKWDVFVAGAGRRNIKMKTHFFASASLLEPK